MDQFEWEREDRLVHARLQQPAVRDFLRRAETSSIHHLEHIPYRRLLLAGHLRDCLGETFQEVLLRDLQAYSGGCIILEFGHHYSREEYIKLALALAHLISLPMPSGSSGLCYSVNTISDRTHSQPGPSSAYSQFTLHTDGVFLDNPVDWVFMLKLHEAEARGGRSRLLHLQDWDGFTAFHDRVENQKKYAHGMYEKGRRFALFRELCSAKPSRARILSMRGDQRRMKFVDQFVIPGSIEEAEFIAQLQSSLETCPEVRAVELPVGSAILLNNNFWLHGREPFERDESLERTLLRQYGYFPDHHDHFDATMGLNF